MDVKWTSTYIKGINYTKIYARAHYHQSVGMFPKLTKGRIMLSRQQEVKQARRRYSARNPEQEETRERLLTFHAGGLRPGRACNLPWEARALDRLRAFFYAVLIAAAMHCDHFARPLLHLVLA